MMTSPPTDHNHHGHAPRVLNNNYFPSSSSSSSTLTATATATATGNTFGIIYDSVTASAVNGKNHHGSQSNSNTNNLNHHNKRLRTGSISGRLRY